MALTVVMIAVLKAGSVALMVAVQVVVVSWSAASEGEFRLLVIPLLDLGQRYHPVHQRRNAGELLQHLVVKLLQAAHGQPESQVAPRHLC